MSKGLAETPVDDHISGLADAVGAVDALVVYRGVPCGIHDDDAIGRRESQTEAAHL